MLQAIQYAIDAAHCICTAAMDSGHVREHNPDCPVHGHDADPAAEIARLREAKEESEDHARSCDEITRIAVIDHERLRVQRDELLAALRAAAQSLQTIAEQAGRDEYMSDLVQTRGYANSRAAVANAILARCQP